MSQKCLSSLSKAPDSRDIRFVTKNQDDLFVDSVYNSLFIRLGECQRNLTPLMRFCGSSLWNSRSTRACSGSKTQQNCHSELSYILRCLRERKFRDISRILSDFFKVPHMHSPGNRELSQCLQSHQVRPPSTG